MTGAPRWAKALLRTLAPAWEADDVIGDLEEAHRYRLRRHRPRVAGLLTAIETLDMTAALIRARGSRLRTNGRDHMVQDCKLGLRMLVKYPGLTIAGGLALAIAIGLGAGWYDFMSELFRPTLPLAGGDRIVEVEMRNARVTGDERRLLHDFLAWRRDLRSIEDLGAYRTLERNLMLGDARPEPVTVAETTASAFRVATVPPLMGRPLIDADEQPGAPAVAVIGFHLWQQRFGGRADAIGRTVQLGPTATTVVGVMPEGFSFPVNHRLWVPLQLRPSGYAPLEGAPIRVFGRLAPGVSQAQAFAEVTTLTNRAAAASPQTHEHLRPRVLAYGGESPGDRFSLEAAVTHLPILLVLIVACTNVGTLIYARTATREGEIAMRSALGASRGRIVTQLFVEALVLALVAAVVGLAAAHWALKWGTAVYYSGQIEAMPFWLDPGLRPGTVLYATGLAVAGAAILGVLPALKATGSQTQAQIRNLGAGGSTLRFGAVWTAAMIAQVALTVICLPPAMGIAEEAVRDRIIRARFPAEQYLAVRVDLDREVGPGEESAAAFTERKKRIYGELQRRMAQEPGVAAAVFAAQLPGMPTDVRRAEVETGPEAPPTPVPNLWTSIVAPGFFAAFDRPIVAGRDFHDGDREAGARAVIVNEAFARRFMGGRTPVGRRVRYAVSEAAAPEAWFDIVGMARDIGMTPTDIGEAPYVFHPASPETLTAAVMGIRVSGDAPALAPRVRAIATALDPGLRLDEVRPLDQVALRVDIPALVAGGTLVGVVGLGLFLSAAGIFSLMSVSVARRTREIGLRSALGASPKRVLAGILRRAIWLVGSGVLAGNAVLVLIVWISGEAGLGFVFRALLISSTLMLVVGLLACVGPATRALRIHPTEALRET